MIQFTKVRWKNFLSTGNAYTEIQLDKHPTTLIIGENGAGKSTMLDAICFSLFGKPYRNINKPQLVNSVNDKQCRVEIEFSIGQKEYKIVRAIKPSVFEIWIDGEMLNQEAATRDYQKYLEDSILKLNYKSFTQIVILGSASFTPFMQLPAAARREVIEDILDIKIFSAMNVVLKQKVTELKDKLVQLDAQLMVAKNRADVQQKYIKTLVDDRDAKIADIEHNILQYNTTIHTLRDELASHEQVRGVKLEAIADMADIIEKLDKLNWSYGDLESALRKVEREIAFYHDNDNCPRCKQGIQHEFKQSIIEEHRAELDEIQSAQREIGLQQDELTQRLTEIKKIKHEIDTLATQISDVKNEISTNERYIQRLTLEKNDIEQKVGNIEAEKQKLKDIAKEAVVLAKDRSDLNETQHYYDIASVMLKDSGIKTRIIKQYLPVINKLVNKYLTAMDFFVQFTLDEKFSESIKSRHRDAFSYESFSEGEKQRIDLALLFTWRTIAKLKNSASTNLLILDEVFDSSLDNNATDQVMTLLNTIGDGTNVWVISHKGDALFDRFNHILKFKKVKNFSVIA